jgi:LysM repeat protein
VLYVHKSNTIWIIILVIVSVLLYDNNFTISNKYLTYATYQVVDVNKGDSLWTISAKYVTDKDDIRHLIAAIKHLNQLDNNTQIYPGQLLKVPIAPDNIKLAIKIN